MCYCNDHKLQINSNWNLFSRIQYAVCTQHTMIIMLSITTHPKLRTNWIQFVPLKYFIKNAICVWLTLSLCVSMYLPNEKEPITTFLVKVLHSKTQTSHLSAWAWSHNSYWTLFLLISCNFRANVNTSSPALLIKH